MNWVFVAFVLLGRQSCQAQMPDWNERGEVAMLPCPLGSYRDSRLGAREDGCFLEHMEQAII